MKVVNSLVLFLAICAGCVTRDEHETTERARSHDQWQQNRLVSVDVSDGISEVEADAIGTDRFNTYRIGCGVASKPMDLGDYWQITTYVGVAATPFEEIRIRKSDGQTTITKAKREGLPKRPSS